MGGTYSIISLAQWYIEGRKYYGDAAFKKKLETWNKDDLDVNLAGKNYIVTGANSGIGFAVAEELARLGGSVHMICRNKERGENAKQKIIEKHGNNNVFLHILDMAEFSQVRKFAHEFTGKNETLECLINNAGALIQEKTLTSEGLELGFATMLGGTYLLTGELLNLLLKSKPSRVINVSSGGMYNVKLDVDLDKRIRYEGSENYALTKRAQVVLTEQWAENISPESGITFYSMHPGWTATPGVESSLPGFFNQHKDILRDIYGGADTILYLAVASKPLGKSGLFWFDREPVQTHQRFARTKNTIEEAREFFNKCGDICGWKLPSDIETKDKETKNLN